MVVVIEIDAVLRITACKSPSEKGAETASDEQ
jgi:hypothetical protein